jgi:pSer/pThr/pTyr-binding forkhead associated (FHA) protein
MIMTYRLRHLGRMLPLGDTPFTVGRNSSCQLAVEQDALISRRHATFRVTAEGVTIEDHDSRNGVVVNGARIEKKALLRAGDTIIIGNQELMLFSDGTSLTALDETGVHRVLAEPKIPSEVIPVAVDYITIAGHSYAVVPKAEYLRMRKKLATDATARATPTATAIVDPEAAAKTRGLPPLVGRAARAPARPQRANKKK